MCFSASVSFAASAALISIGAYASKVAWDKESRYLPLAIMPLAFGIQQGLEGITWLGLVGNQPNMTQVGSLGFLFFSHGFWLVWPAFIAFMVEHRPWVKKLLMVLMIIGFIGGVSLYGPLLIYPDWLLVTIRQGSIDYQVKLLYDNLIPMNSARLLYLLITMGPLWLAESSHIKVLGGLIALSAISTYWLFNYAFVSVWCFFAAILSLYIAYILQSVSLIRPTPLEPDQA